MTNTDRMHEPKLPLKQSQNAWMSALKTWDATVFQAVIYTKLLKTMTNTDRMYYKELPLDQKPKMLWSQIQHIKTWETNPFQ